MKPTELSLATGLSDIKELIESIELEGKTSMSCKTYREPQNLESQMFCEDQGRLLIYIRLFAKEILDEKDFEFKVSYGVLEEKPIKKKLYFSMVGSKDKGIYHIIGIDQRENSRTIYEKTNIEGLLD
ncbi:hypothetical protein HYX19_03790 [Candidatus Woesearchaeota archaeon]|nr:hypothetical protein [Candidatus Woesearchaeota archaeon]